MVPATTCPPKPLPTNVKHKAIAFLKASGGKKHYKTVLKKNDIWEFFETDVLPLGIFSVCNFNLHNFQAERKAMTPPDRNTPFGI